MFPRKTGNNISVLDERSSRLLAAINGICENGGYRIIEERELLGAFSAADGVDGARLSEMLSRLETQRYLEIRYAEDGEYCLRPLSAGVRYSEQERGEKREAFRRRREAALFALAGGAVGGFLGALIACLAVTA